MLPFLFQNVQTQASNFPQRLRDATRDMFSGELTFAAVLPHAQVDVRDVVTAAVAVWQLGHLEDVLLDASDVVAVVAQHPRQRRLFQLRQLSRAEHTRVFIPEPGQNRAGSA